MPNYLKKILFSLLILVTPYMDSASNAMNEDSDYNGSTIRARNVSFVSNDQQDVQSFSKPSTTSKVENLEDSKVSWTSYLYSPVKSISQSAYEIMDFAIQKPKVATFIGLSYMISAAVALDCTSCYKCACYGSPYPLLQKPCDYKVLLGTASNLLECAHVCNITKSYFCGCKEL